MKSHHPMSSSDSAASRGAIAEPTLESGAPSRRHLEPSRLRLSEVFIRVDDYLINPRHVSHVNVINEEHVMIFLTAPAPGSVADRFFPTDIELRGRDARRFLEDARNAFTYVSDRCSE